MGKHASTNSRQWRERFRTWSGTLLARCGPLPLVVEIADRDTTAVAAAAVLASVPGSVVFVTADTAAAENMLAALDTYAAILGDDRPRVAVPEVSGPRNRWVPENEAARCSALHAALAGAPLVFVLSATALLAPAPAPAEFRRQVFTLVVGDEIDPDLVAGRLLRLDYDNEPEVHLPGEFSRRGGGILDVFSPAERQPVRLEFFGNRLESMRRFDPETQRSVGATDSLTVVPRGEVVLTPDAKNGTACFLDYAGPDAALVIAHPGLIRGHLERFAPGDALDTWSQLTETRNRRVVIELAGSGGAAPGAAGRLVCGAVGLGETLGVLIPDLGNQAGIWHWQQLRDHLRRWSGMGYAVVACCGTKGEADRFRQRVEDDEALQDVVPAIECFALDRGVLIPAAHLALLSERELFGRRPETARRTRRNPYRTDHALHEGTELEPGAFAVHAAHGICRYHGIREIEVKGELQEVMELEFDNDARLYVPLEECHLVSRYVGGTRKAPKLSRLGGPGWRRKTDLARAAATDLAAELLRLDAVRRNSAGARFRPEPDWEQAFAQSFPFEETEDQRRALLEVFHDMEAARPMDRLLCGDVGYGKTEVAMRAAFRAVLNGKQVALLVPTTVLAQQHLLTFRERLAEYPVVVEMLSRFRSDAEQKRILERLATGNIDIVIGTHRLLSADVKFRDLGLLIIDEEQRFGVRHKERLKHLRTQLDILTMTATPIPRTLYFSLSGLRNLSTISTPPAERLPVTTVVAQYDTGLIREAIENEIERNGQVFFLHNRVHSIESVRKRLEALVPDARFGVAHGQMPAHELENVMRRFVLREIDVLICTTIIESGLDIPNANTIIIDRADRFGLADLYQLRGRVGRYRNQAYAYLLLPPMGTLPANAHERLAAIRRYTHLGAGFRIALRDLEIRGAGNILGAEQSGHIAAVGFDLYCQLLREAISRLEHRPPPRRPAVLLRLDFLSFSLRAPHGRLTAAVPPEYVGDEEVRAACYRRLAELTDIEQVRDFGDELRDRFGPLPPPVERLLETVRLRIVAARLKARTVTVQGRKVLIETDHGLVLDDRRLPLLSGKRPKEKRLGELRKLLERLATRKPEPGRSQT
ncbi:MAG: transcription-repair coupling factor [Kiritimatiellaeota bacterium]|nr:transcription-repair coupling factor [Kiritimatiellota bacterium]